MSDETTSDHLVEAEIAKYRNRNRAIPPGPIPQRTEGVFAPAVGYPMLGGRVEPMCSRMCLASRLTPPNSAELRLELACGGGLEVPSDRVFDLALNDRSAVVRLQALQIASERPGPEAAAVAESAQDDPDPHVRIEAKAMLARLAARAAISPALPMLTGRGVVAQLPVRIIPPAIRRPVTRQGARVRTTRGKPLFTNL